MGPYLTKRYSSFFNQKGWKKVSSLIANGLAFLEKAFRSGKLGELSSFAIWESRHVLKLFPKESYLRFNDRTPLILSSASPTDFEFSGDIETHALEDGLRATRSLHDWRVLFVNDEGISFGCLSSDDTKLYKSDDGENTLIPIGEFPARIRSIFVSSTNTVFVCLSGSVLRSSDGGATFEECLRLASPVSIFRFNNGMTETSQGTLIIGEYGNVPEGRGWRSIAYLYFSDDDGRTWHRSDFLIRNGANKHVHVVRYSKSLDKILVADGDNKKRLWMVEETDGGRAEPSTVKWRLVTKRHIQKGGYTAVTDSNGKVFLGTDYLGGTNFIVESTDGHRFTAKVMPDPYRRNPVYNLIERRSRRGSEIWAISDSYISKRCLLMYSTDHGTSWNKFIEYDSATHECLLASSSIEPSDVLYFRFATKAKDNKDCVVLRIESVD